MNMIRRAIRPEQIREFSLLFIIVLAVMFFATQIQNYISPRTFTRISVSTAIIAVVAIGQTLVILTRNVDLSVGSIVGCSAYFVGSVLGANESLPPALAIVIALAFGAGLGLLNGLLIAFGRIPAIIVTLGTQAIFRGALVELANSKTITTASLPEWIVGMSGQNFTQVGELNIRVVFVFAIVCLVIFQIFLAFFSTGRRLYAVGSNPDAAQISGLPKRRLVLIAYTACGALAGLGGFMYLAQYGNIEVTAAQGLELQVIAACVVGGVNIFGGTGTAFGALLGAILIGTLDQSLTRMPNISQFWQNALLGLFILMAIASDAIIMNRLRAWWTRSSFASTSSTSAPSLANAPQPTEQTP
jgi:rhamnose transport system permease protein